jgi:hypothetical protein
MVNFVHRNRISLTAMYLGLLYQIMTYTNTNYVTWCRYLCSVVYHIKICFLLHAHKFRMVRMCVERKWIGMHGNKKFDLNALFRP